MNSFASAGEASLSEKRWQEALDAQRKVHSFPKFVENGIAGVSIFALGTYGSYYEKQALVTSTIYSLMQTGGIILASQAIRDYLQPELLLSVDRLFESKKMLSRQEFQNTWHKVETEKQKADLTADIFLWTGLAGIYVSSGLREPKTSDTMRSLYFFLAANSVILGSVAGYGLMTHKFENGSSGQISFSQKFQGASLDLNMHL